MNRRAASKEVAADPFAAWSGTLTTREGPDAIAAADLGRRSIFEGVIDRFQSTHLDADRAAAVSLWSQIYFNALIIPAVVQTLSYGEALPLDLATTRVSLCPISGVALAFQMRPRAGSTPAEWLFAPLLDRHV